MFNEYVQDSLTKFIEGSDRVVRVLSEVSRRRSMTETYDAVKKSLELFIRAFTDIECEALYCGSRPMGIASAESDLDFFIDVRKLTKDCK